MAWLHFRPVASSLPASSEVCCLQPQLCSSGVRRHLQGWVPTQALPSPLEVCGARTGSGCSSLSSVRPVCHPDGELFVCLDGSYAALLFTLVSEAGCYFPTAPQLPSSPQGGGATGPGESHGSRPRPCLPMETQLGRHTPSHASLSELSLQFGKTHLFLFPEKLHLESGRVRSRLRSQTRLYTMCPDSGHDHSVTGDCLSPPFPRPFHFTC